MKFVCPKCARPLMICDKGAAKCENNHSFDRSREGYYNLLLSVSGGVHGDNKEMLLSRRRFLDTGAYEPLAETVSMTLLSRLNSDSSVLDMGCGEGYYTDYIEKAFRESFGKISISAFDISKEAVRLAAKRNKNISFAVASSYKIPAGDESFDACLNIFSPMAIEETLRVLKKGGTFVMVIPNEEHLFGLKSAIYDKPYKNEVSDTYLPSFELVGEEKLSYTLPLDSAEKISDLFMMTPYAYRTGSAERKRIEKLKRLDCNAEFIILTYRKL